MQETWLVVAMFGIALILFLYSIPALMATTAPPKRSVSFHESVPESPIVTLHPQKSEVLSHRARGLSSPRGRDLLRRIQQELALSLGIWGIVLLPEDMQESIAAAVLDLVLRGREEIVASADIAADTPVDSLFGQMKVDKIVEIVMHGLFHFDEEREELYLSLTDLLELVEENVETIAESEEGKPAVIKVLRERFGAMSPRQLHQVAATYTHSLTRLGLL